MYGLADRLVGARPVVKETVECSRLHEARWSEARWLVLIGKGRCVVQYMKYDVYSFVMDKLSSTKPHRAETTLQRQSENRSECHPVSHSGLQHTDVFQKNRVGRAHVSSTLETGERPVQAIF